MKTLLLFVALLFGTMAMAPAQEFTVRQGNRLSLPIAPDGQETIQQAPKPQEAIDGVVAMAVRTGQPLQMINPVAPKEFGDGTKMVSRNPPTPQGKADGIILLGFRF